MKGRQASHSKTAYVTGHAMTHCSSCEYLRFTHQRQLRPSRCLDLCDSPKGVCRNFKAVAKQYPCLFLVMICIVLAVKLYSMPVLLIKHIPGRLSTIHIYMYIGQIFYRSMYVDLSGDIKSPGFEYLTHMIAYAPKHLFLQSSWFASLCNVYSNTLLHILMRIQSTPATMESA